MYSALRSPGFLQSRPVLPGVASFSEFSNPPPRLVLIEGMRTNMRRTTMYGGLVLVAAFSVGLLVIGCASGRKVSETEPLEIILRLGPRSGSEIQVYVTLRNRGTEPVCVIENSISMEGISFSNPSADSVHVSWRVAKCGFARAEG